jgi:hypothetical protein
MRKYLKIELGILLWLVCLLIGCDYRNKSNDGIPVENLLATTIPDVENYGNPGANQDLEFPGPLRCEYFNMEYIKPGQIWRDLQIGKTTYSEMVQVLERNGADISIRWNDEIGRLEVRSNTPFISPLYDEIFDACFVGDILVMLDIYGVPEQEYPSSLESFVQKYGIPDVVTWSNHYYFRSLIWLGEGILIQVDVINNEQYSGINLFPPIEGDYEDSWLYVIMPENGGKYIWNENEDVDLGLLPPEKEVENPWAGYFMVYSIFTDPLLWFVVIISILLVTFRYLKAKKAKEPN